MKRHLTSTEPYDRTILSQAWKSINGFVVTFKSSFDQLKIKFYKEIKKKKNEKVMLQNCQSPWKRNIYLF